MTFLVALLSIFLSVLHLSFAFNANGFDFVFNTEQYAPNAPRALFVPEDNPMRYLAENQFTFCFHAFLDKFQNNEVETLFSYACSENVNEVLLQIRQNLNELHFHIQGGTQHIFKVLPPREKWTHICLSWNSDGGVLKMYFDGKEVAKTNGFKDGVFLDTKNGTMYLGQHQYGIRGNFQASDGMRGKITFFNVWNRELTADEVIQVQSCNLEGNIVIWSSDKWVMAGHADIEPSSAPCRAPCKRTELETMQSCDHPTTALTAKKAFSGRGDLFMDRTMFVLPGNVKFKEFSLCAWFYHEAKYEKLVQTFINRQGSFDDSAWISIGMEGTNLKFSIYGEMFSASGVVRDKWQHFCVIWSGINNDSIEMYISGKQSIKSALSKHGSTFSGGGFHIFQFWYSKNDARNPVESFAHKVSSIDIWDYALTPKQVLQTYNCRTVLPGNVIDSQNYTKYVCNTTSDLDLKEGDFSNGPILVEGDIMKNNLSSPYHEISICFSVFYSSPCSVTPCVPFVFRDIYDPKPSFIFQRDKGVDSINLDVQWTPNATVILGLKTGDWQLICVTYTRNPEGKLKIYLNSQLVVDIDSVPIVDWDGFAGDQYFQLNQLQSEAYDAMDPTKGFEWKLTDFNFWDRIITADEVLQVNNCNSSVIGNIVNAHTNKIELLPTVSTNEIVTTFPPETTTFPPEKSCDHPTTAPTDNKEIPIQPNDDLVWDEKRYALPSDSKFKEFSLCAWFYYEAKYAKKLQAIIQRRSPFDNAWILVGVHGTDLMFGMNEGRFSASGIVPDKWQHFCVIWSGINNDSIKMYINGNQSLQSALEKHDVVFLGAELRFYQFRYSRNDPRNPVEGFAQKVSGIDMWDYALTTKQVLQTYSCRTVLPGNVIDWQNYTKHVCDNPISTPRDTLVKYYQDSKKPTPDRAFFPLPNNITIQEFSICTWAFYEEKHKNPIGYKIIGWWNKQVEMSIITNVTDVLFIFNEEEFGAIGIGPDKWHHICAMWSGIHNDTIDLYINGKQSLHSSLKKPGGSFSGGKLAYYQTRYAAYDAQNLMYGVSQKVSGIDIWNFVLTPEQLNKTYDCRQDLPGNVLNWDNLPEKN